MAPKRDRALTKTEQAFLSSTTAKRLGSYAQDDPETHLLHMTRGTCSVCGRTFSVRRGRLAWHKFPGSLIVHPRIHRPDHCLGFLYPPAEFSDKGTRAYYDEVCCLLDAVRTEEGSEFYETVRRVRDEFRRKLSGRVR